MHQNQIELNQWFIFKVNQVKQLKYKNESYLVLCFFKQFGTKCKERQYNDLIRIGINSF